MNAHVSASPLNVLEDCYFFWFVYIVFSFFRDGRFNVPRGSLPLDEQHRLQRHNQMSSGKNLQQNSISTHGAVSGLGHRVVPGVNNTTGVSGTNRGTPVSSGFQGMGSPAMPNNVSMLSSGMVGIPNSGRGASQGNSMLRPPREAVQHMMRVSNLAFIYCYANCYSKIYDYLHEGT